MKEAPSFWETSVHAVEDKNHKQIPLIVTAKPREGDPIRGIDIVAFLVTEPREPLMIINAFFEDNIVQVGDGCLEITNDSFKRQGIGSICLGKAFAWAKHYHAAIAMSPFKIASKKTSKEAKGLKRLYEAFGMSFSQPRPTVGSWYCDDLRCSQLVIPLAPEPHNARAWEALDAFLEERRREKLQLSVKMVAAERKAEMSARYVLFYRYALVIMAVSLFLLLLKSAFL